jgi:hypothetical protein
MGCSSGIQLLHKNNVHAQKVTGATAVLDGYVENPIPATGGWSSVEWCVAEPRFFNVRFDRDRAELTEAQGVDALTQERGPVASRCRGPELRRAAWLARRR